MLLLPRYQGVKHICGALPANVAATRISMNAFLQSGLRPPTDSPESASCTEGNKTGIPQSSVASAPKNWQQLAKPLKEVLQQSLNLLKTHLPAEKGEQEEFSKRLFKFIEKASFLDEVQRAQMKVMQIKDDLRRTGDEKRKIMRELQNVRNELTRIYAMKCTSNRSSQEFLELVKNELNLCQKDQQLQDAFEQADSEGERLLNLFDSAINESHEKEKVHTNFVKIMGVLSSIVAAVLTAGLGLIGYIHNQKKYDTFKQDVDDSISRNLNKLGEILRNHGNKQESWGSYFKRHSRWIYGWAMPKN